MSNWNDTNLLNAIQNRMLHFSVKKYLPFEYFLLKARLTEDTVFGFGHNTIECVETVWNVFFFIGERRSEKIIRKKNTQTHKQPSISCVLFYSFSSLVGILLLRERRKKRTKIQSCTQWPICRSRDKNISNTHRVPLCGQRFVYFFSIHSMIRNYHWIPLQAHQIWRWISWLRGVWGLKKICFNINVAESSRRNILERIIIESDW